MKKRIEVRSQAEFDACVQAGNIAVVTGCSVVARGNSSVVARGNSSVEARGNSSVEARGNSSVEAWGNSSVEARGNSSVEAWENSSVEARGNSSVEARGNSSVEAWENSSVEAWENSSVEAWEDSSVVAWENSSVVAWGNVFVRLFSALRVKASIHVAVVIHGSGHSVEGGNQIHAANPQIGAEWCEYYGIDPAKADFVVPNIDAAILASIQKNAAAGTNGLDMTSWHGDDSCDETNWCNTTHCRAGYAICLAGKPGWELQRKHGSEIAGRMIYAASRPDMRLPDFHASTGDAMADIEACAAAQASAS